MNKKLFDFLIFAIILCSVISGIWIGQRVQAEKSNDFFINYINSECRCSIPLEIDGNKISYKTIKVPEQFGYNSTFNQID